MSLDFVKILELPEQRTATTVTLVLLLQRLLLLRKRRLGAMCQNGAYNFCCTFVVVVCVWKNRQKKWSASYNCALAANLKCHWTIKRSNQPTTMDDRWWERWTYGWLVAKRQAHVPHRSPPANQVCLVVMIISIKSNHIHVFCLSSTKCPSMKQNKKKNMEWPP